MLVLLVIVILALPHARPWAHKVSLRNSHSLLYVTKEAHFFPSLNSSLTTLNSTPANFPHDVIIPVFSSVPGIITVPLLYVVYMLWPCRRDMLLHYLGRGEFKCLSCHWESWEMYVYEGGGWGRVEVFHLISSSHQHPVINHLGKVIEMHWSLRSQH